MNDQLKSIIFTFVFLNLGSNIDLHHIHIYGIIEFLFDIPVSINYN